MRALARLLPSLGPRWVLVGDGAAALPPADPRPAVAVTLSSGCPGDVRGATDRWPIQSEAATGALLRVADGALAARALPEALRVLQPGGRLIVAAAWRADAVPAFLAAIDAAGLVVLRRIAVGIAAGIHDRPQTALERWFPAWAAFRASSAAPATRIDCVFVAARPGGFDAPLPTAGDVLASMFLPSSWRRPTAR